MHGNLPTTKVKSKKPVATWRDKIAVHPAAELFPLMGEAELRELADDIEKNGLLEKVAYIRVGAGPPILLDGRNRLNALELLGRELFVSKYSGEAIGGSDMRRTKKRFALAAADEDRSCPSLQFFATAYAADYEDPTAYIIAKNIRRRHLSTEQKRDLIAKVLKATPEASNRTIAKQTKASHVTVGAIRTELETTGQIDQLEKTVGKDGKKRPVKTKKNRFRPRRSRFPWHRR
jgi:hypothetical protein